MQYTTFRSVIVLLMLLGGIFIVYAPKEMPAQDSLPASHRHRAELVSQSEDQSSTRYRYITDLDYWQRTERESVVETTVHLDLAHDLNDIPLQIGDWRGEDVPETNMEVFRLLEPEQFVQRRYRNSQGQYLWLNLIGSRKSRSFHPPDLCYIADGWQAHLSSQVISLDNGDQIYGLWLKAEKQFPDRAKPTEHRIFYFYLFPDRERDQRDGIVLFKLTSPPYGTIEETVTLQADFLGHIFKEVGQSLTGRLQAGK